MSDTQYQKDVERRLREHSLQKKRIEELESLVEIAFFNNHISKEEKDKHWKVFKLIHKIKP